MPISYDHELRVISAMVVLLGAASIPVPAQPQARASIITAVPGVGGAQRGCSGLASDSAGNLFLANGDILRIAAGTGAVSTLLHTPNNQMQGPTGVAVDKAGNIYVADPISGRVWKLRPDGKGATPVAGIGMDQNGRPISVEPGNGGPATKAFLDVPTYLALGPDGSLYIAGKGMDPRIRKVALNTGIITQIGGKILSDGLAVDSKGTLYFSDELTMSVWRTNAGQPALVKVAGNGRQAYSGDGGPAPAAGLAPMGLAFDSADNLYIADSENNRVRVVPAGTGIIFTVAGNGTGGYTKTGDGDGGPATSAMVSIPIGLAIGASDNLFVCTSGLIRKVANVRDAVASRPRSGSGGVPAGTAPSVAPAPPPAAQAMAGARPPEVERGLSLPPVMHFCAANCFTLTLDGGHYNAGPRYSWVPPNWTAVWTVVKFTRLSVVLHRHESNGFDAVYTGTISPDGNRLVNVSANGNPDRSLRFAWGAFLNSVPGSNDERDRGRK